MRKYAMLENNLVVEVLELDEDAYMAESKYHQIIIDVEDLLITPQIGWVLVGNSLVSQEPALSLEEYEIVLADKKTNHGISLAREAINKIGARNKMLNKTGPQVVTLLNQLVGVKMLLETGALSTARYSCTQLKSVYVEYADIFDLVIFSINDFEQEYGL